MEAHGLVVEARLDRGDRNGARRALFRARTALDELAVSPERGLTELGHRSGLP